MIKTGITKYDILPKKLGLIDIDGIRGDYNEILDNIAKIDDLKQKNFKRPKYYYDYVLYKHIVKKDFIENDFEYYISKLEKLESLPKISIWQRLLFRIYRLKDLPNITEYIILGYLLFILALVISGIISKI